jgi:16S rRNA (adenine1518-N6/adenine1519-N6)-dimethyltransferase
MNYIFPKKSLGQNFLKSEAAIKQMIESAEIKEGDFVLEIGPGKGALTEKLLIAGAKVLAIEKDERLIEELKEKFFNFKENLEILNLDILDFDPEKILLEKEYKLVANIPYYITGLIIRKFLETKKQPTLSVLLVQKEVAQRIVAQDKKESLLSVSVKIYCEPKLIKTVKAGSFVPAPKVDSAIIKLDKISKENFEKNNITEKYFFEIVKAGFSHNRKKITSNLSEIINKNEIEKFFAKEKINPSTRAEDLNIEQFIKIAKYFGEKNV